MAAENSHHFARNDEEEALALELALAASLADAQEQQPQLQGAERAQPQAPPQPPPQQQQQFYPPVGPPPPPPQQQQQQQPRRGSNSGSGSGQGAGAALQSLLQKPLKLLDSALAKAAEETGSFGPRCGGCSKWLGMGAAMQALGQHWHPQCFRCAGCGQPFSLDGSGHTFVVGHDDGLPYHSQCHRQLFHPRCCVCGGFVPERPDGRTEWHERPFWRHKHCPAHASDGTPQCCSCGLLQPRSEEWVGLQDGRHLCLSCLETLVVDTKDAQPLYDEVLAYFGHMGMPHPYKVPLLLVEGPVLDEYASREGRAHDGGHAPMFSVRGLCVAHVYTTIPSVVRALAGGSAVSSVATRVAPLQQHCEVNCLLVMYGLPRLLLGSITAHELMHAYLRMRHVTGLPLQVEEGLCQLMAMLWLDSQDHWAKRQGGEYQEQLLSYLGWQIRNDRSEVYGEGFRIALEKFQQRGLRALVEHVIAHGAWPDWQA